MGYVYVCIDVLSRYAWVEPIETKTTENCKKAIEKIIKKSNRKPQMIYSDRGYSDSMVKMTKLLNSNLKPETMLKLNYLPIPNLKQV